MTHTLHPTPTPYTLRPKLVCVLQASAVDTLKTYSNTLKPNLYTSCSHQQWIPRCVRPMTSRVLKN